MRLINQAVEIAVNTTDSKDPCDIIDKIIKILESEVEDGYEYLEKKGVRTKKLLEMIGEAPVQRVVKKPKEEEDFFTRRNAYGITRAEVAKKANVAPSTIFNYEFKNCKPHPLTRYKLENALEFLIEKRKS